MTLPITPLYAALLTLLYLRLSLNVIRARNQFRVALGSGGNAALERAQRVHGNFAEYAPLALLLIAMAELRGAPWPLVHALGLTLLTWRGLHAYGVSRTPETMRYRVRGMQLTFAALAAAAGLILAQAVLPL